MRIITVTPRTLMEQGAWEKARDLSPAICAQWVYDSGLESLDKPVYLTADEAREAGYAAPRWSRLRESLPSWPVAVFLLAALSYLIWRLA
jgi:hypothetical protein